MSHSAELNQDQPKSTQTKVNSKTTEKPVEVQPDSVTEETVAEEATQSTEVVLCPDVHINAQLTQALKELKGNYENSQMSLSHNSYPGLYKALTRIFANLENPYFNQTLSNLLQYFYDNFNGHCGHANVLQGVERSQLSVNAQRELIKLVSLFVQLRDPNGRGQMAKTINWDTFPNAFELEFGKTVTKRLKSFFNIN